MVEEAAQLQFSQENDLLNLLQATAQELREILQQHEAEEETGPDRIFNENRDSAGIYAKLFLSLRKFCVLHTQRVCVLREVLCGTANTLTEHRMCSDLACALPNGESQVAVANVDAAGAHFFQDKVTDVILNVVEDVHIIMRQLHVMCRRLDTGIAFLPKVNDGSLNTQNKWEENEPLDTTEQTKTGLCDISVQLEQSTHQNLQLTNVQLLNGPALDQMTNSAVCMEKTRDEMSPFLHTGDEQTGDDLPCETMASDYEKKINDESRGEESERKQELVTVGLEDQSDDRSSDSPHVCYITTPPEVADVMTCKVVDGLSSLMVSGSEELVSSVIRIENTSNIKCPFPLTVAVPFQASYRGNYREITVKVVDLERRVSYVTPTSTEGFYGGQRGSYAVIRVYSLGVFAVLSRLRTETFTIPKSGLSLKLSVDSRICLDYLPGSFTTPVFAQVMVQPVDTAVLSSLKSKDDSYHAVLASTPLLYLNQPSTLKLRRPLTFILPCPPNSDKRRSGEDFERPVLVSGTLSHQRIRVDSASVKSPKDCREQLTVLGWMENHWKVLDKVNVRNLQNGLVSFELTENYDRLIVLRVQSSMKLSVAASLVEELEEAVKIFSVTILLHQDPLDPSSVVVATLPSRDLSWELSELQGLAYCGLSEPSSEIHMREGEQLLLKFSGNITCNDNQGTDSHVITFHNQRKKQLYLRLKEVDPFGNYSSPHYKGVASLFRVTRGHLVWNGDAAALSKDCPLEDPVCRLPLTLPKGARTVFRPVSAKVMQHRHSDSLSDELLSWLCDELTENDAALLVVSLRLRRSAVQIARLRAPHNLSQQAFHILTAWRRGLPSSFPKCSMLAQCLTHAGRPDLAKELLLRESTDSEQRKPE
nr:death domain-containing protein 1 [Misgurnus anguillicaudatus]